MLGHGAAVPILFAFAGREMHEIPCKERIRQREISMDPRDRQPTIIEVNAFFKIATLGNPPIARDGVMTDVSKKEQVAMPVIKPLAKIDTRTMQRVDQRSFH